MAKAVFHKNQRVFVKPVGTWAGIEHIKPQWVKDVEEPVRIFYDVGLGRDFSAQELVKESDEAGSNAPDRDNWRLIRSPNKWRSFEDCDHHPFPGTYPIVVTDSNDWGGWRVPGAEYDRDPARIEFQARVVANALRLLRLCDQLARCASEEADDLPSGLIEAAREADAIIRYVYGEPHEDAGAAQAAE